MGMAHQTTSGTAAWMRATANPTSARPAAFVESAVVEPPAAGVRRTGRHVESADRADLPRRCACCGDTIDLRAFRTLPGRVRYFVCQEHLVSAIARLLIGIAMMLVGLWGIVDGGGAKVLLAFGLIGVGGLLMTWFAIPVRAGRSRNGWRKLRGICRATADEIDPASV